MPRLNALGMLLVLILPLSAAPVPKAVKRPQPPAVVGTSWVGTNGNNSTYTYTFNADGTFAAEQNGRPYSQGHWKQDGDTLEWDFNNRYAVYTVTFKDGNFEGSAVNVKGKSWEVTLKPLPK